MQEQKFLYYLLYSALSEIRTEGENIKNKRVYWVSDLLRKLPLVLDQAASDEEYECAFMELKKNAEKKKLSFWLESRLKEFNYREKFLSQREKGD